MIIPVRCFSCGKPIGHLWKEYKRRVAAGESLGQEDFIELVGKFKKS